MKICIIGGGAFGTALGFVLADKGIDTSMLVRNKELAADINEKHRNSRYLPGIELPEKLTASLDYARALEDAAMAVYAVPMPGLREVLRKTQHHLPEGASVVAASKGIERGTLSLPSEIMKDELPSSFHDGLLFLSGPSFAHEIAQRMPTVVCIASHNEDAAKEAQHAFACDYFRVYRSRDVKGVELGGAIKNVIAIAAGVGDGLGMGHNTRSAIVTRGLAEMTRLGRALGADPMTFMGLSGLGDLVLTCTADLSRNRRLGIELGRGHSLMEIQKGMKQTVEGVATAEAVYNLAMREGVNMTICTEIYEILYKGKQPSEAVAVLMRRELKEESE